MIGSGKIVTDGLIFNVDAADENSYPGEGSTWFDLCPDSDNGAITNATFNKIQLKSEK